MSCFERDGIVDRRNARTNWLCFNVFPLDETICETGRGKSD